MSSKRKVASVAIFSLLVFPIFFFPAPLVNSSTVNSGNSTIISYHVKTQDIFPGLTSIDVSVIGDFSATFDSSDGNIQPGGSAEYSITANQGPGALTVNYNIDRPLLKRSGSKSISVDTIIGDSPPITVYDDGTISIVVTIHVDLSGTVSASGPGSVTPETITWLDWTTKDLTVTASNTAESGQMITIQTSTTYEVYFTVEIRLISLFEAYTQDSPKYGVLGSPIIQNSYSVYVQEGEGGAGPDYTLYIIGGLVIAVAVVTFIVVRRKPKAKV